MATEFEALMNYLAGVNQPRGVPPPGVQDVLPPPYVPTVQAGPTPGMQQPSPTQPRAPVVERGFPAQPGPPQPSPTQQQQPGGFAALLNDPMLQLGMQALAAGGPQAQPMSFGQRALGAMQGFGQQQQQQAQQRLNQERVQMERDRFQFTREDRAREQQQREQLEAQQRLQRDAFMQLAQENPDRLHPIARQLLDAGVPPSELRGLGIDIQPPVQKAPTIRTMHLPNGMQQDFAFNTATGRLDPVSPPVPRWAPRELQADREKTPTPSMYVDIPQPGGQIQKYRWNPATQDHDIPAGAPFQRSANQFQALVDRLEGRTDPAPQPAPATPAVPAAAMQPPAVQQFNEAAQRSPSNVATGRIRVAPGSTSGTPLGPTLEAAPALGSQANPVPVTTKAEFDALPTGAFYARNGKTYRKE